MKNDRRAKLSIEYNADLLMLLNNHAVLNTERPHGTRKRV